MSKFPVVSKAGAAQGTTSLSFGADITVNSLTVNSATSLTATITISSNATVGPRTVMATSGAEVASLANGFTVVSNQGSDGPFTCSANSGVPPLVRAEGFTELVGDILLTCTGGVAGTTAPLQVFLNTNITSRQLGASGETEASLIVDELSTTGGGTPAVYRGLRTSQENAIVWPGVSIVQPGPGQRVLRVVNLRANAALIGAATTLIPNQITAFISASPSQALPLNNPQQTVAYVQRGLLFDVTNCAGTETMSNIDLAQCVGVNSSGSRNLISGTTGEMQFAVRFQEGFQTAFKPRIAPDQIPSVPGNVYHSESGFVRSTSDLPYAIGGADSGSRIVARFQNVPAGVRLFVTIGAAGGSSGSVQAVLVQTGPNGEGGTATQAGSPLSVQSTVRLNCPGGLADVPGVEIPVANGVAMAVWEVSAANAAQLETATFGVALAYAPDTQNRTPAVGQVTVGGNFGPFYSTEAGGRSSASLPIPRFADQPVRVNAFAIQSCVTNLLFPFVTGRAGFDTGIAISNTSRDHFGDPSRRVQAGACTINYFGQTEGGGSAPAPQKTNDLVLAGGTLTFVLSSGGNYGIAGTPGFQGYLIAQCDFQYGHGFAFITDGPIGSARVAEGYLALILNSGVQQNRGATAESLGN